MKLVVLALLLAACSNGTLGSSDEPPPASDGGAPGAPGDDAGLPCMLSLSSFPARPVAGQPVVVRSTLADAAQTPSDYHWRIDFNGTAIEFSKEGDGRQGSFIALEPGVYRVDLELAGVPGLCSTASTMITVRAPGTNSGLMRLHVIAPRTSAAPPFEKMINMPGGADFDLGEITVESGEVASPLVMGPGGGVPGYLRFSPSGAPDAIVEAFSDHLGNTSVRLVLSFYSVLIVPSVPGVAPRRIVNWSSASSFLVVDAGARIEGDVRDSDDAPLPRAQVQLTVDGAPSTLATTDAAGGFVLRASLGNGPVTVEVTPPAGSGLPRLSATSSAFDLARPLAIRYSAGLPRRNLAGTRVMRADAPVGHADVAVVGSMALIGKVTAGTAADASGEVLVTARTDDSGALPSMLIPAAALSAVITAAPGDLAVVALDATDGVPASIEAPAMRSFNIAISDAGGALLRGAVLDAIPLGALAIAGVPGLHVIAGDSGEVTGALAAGGHYDLRFRDPAGRAAPFIVRDRTVAMQSILRLPPAKRVKGRLKYAGQVLPNASVQILCEECTGIERTRPLAEVASDAAGRFELAVPDPGTM